ncbi:Membrane carboxypeptidase (penicillin-binding protein) [Streptoalloteichus tenebrarius]|uniref:Membrane carboxypeptidase (Penicillin-binding protein) n=1 Tax=Streptoalloteichus tenebrarius (strain ATCC 17920 / DSM 40477 / JCM 4838 / CBS 697.72 / NBRC 16177 / NCIMB 11028 / NRRL B-12390 / A12253. 1 / ISP 5477) TaxID=1933 RepID=A0ABT1HR77_STRSD|nr:transglycosylase domain-containing protein [Streptoalloteichus tenebrarius]MCP2258026.1 Membrane carboxypeptidase (penicillin-binding protein) [Streptoalloteichus tenebrarius]BFF01695.1 transglycosylase/D,D-transpeptidase PonA2 [Streptoalloteichus tenebrarius]
MRVRDGLLQLLGLCVLAGVLVAGMLFPVVGSIGVVSNRASDTVDNISADLVGVDPPLVTTITDVTGNAIAYLYDQYRVLTPPDKIADTMKAAIVAMEDKRFYEHDGVDWRGTMRAFVTNQLHGEIAQGGSSLTQQYIKNYLVHVVAKTPTERARATEQTPARKLREIRVALQLEKRLGKDEILTRYLNVVPFGNQTYGVAAAARTYFDTTPDQLTIPQAAMLAGLVNQPGYLNPVTNPDGAVKRRNTVIDKMVEYGSITREMGEEAKQQPLGLVQPLNMLQNGCIGAGPSDGFFCSYVLQYLERAGFSLDNVKRGGYTIRTTLDPLITKAAKQAAEAQVPKQTKGIANAMAVVQPGRDRHRVRALVANRDYGLDVEKGQTQYDLPSGVTKFGAGSIYKIFVAAAALEKGMGIHNIVDVPSSYTSRVYLNNLGPYTVHNAPTASYRSSMTLQDALAQSPNTTFVKLQERVGLDAAVDMAIRLGLREGMQGVNRSGEPLARDGSNGPSQAQFIKDNKIGPFTLGFGPTSVLELANVSATLMSGGMWCPPSPIEEVLDRHGRPVPLTEAPCEQVVASGLANTLAIGLSKDDQQGGTAFNAAKEVDWNRPMIGKTGTTENYHSAGFTGSTPQFSGATLIFTDGVGPQGICDGKPPRLCGNGGHMFGGMVPARTWFAAMKEIHAGLPAEPLPPADPRYLHGGSEVRVPDVVGKAENEARTLLEQAGYKVERRSINSSFPKGVVASQSPRGVALPGEMVTIWVSSGHVPQPSPSEGPSATSRPESPGRNAPDQGSTPPSQSPTSPRTTEGGQSTNPRFSEPPPDGPPPGGPPPYRIPTLSPYRR